jgi:thioredoxin 2
MGWGIVDNRPPCNPAPRHDVDAMTDTLHIVCPHCHTTNRVRTDQLGSAPDCGSCKKPLFTGQPADLDVAAFDKHLPCKQMAPAYVQATAQLEPRIRVAKVDTEAHQALGARYQIRSIPTLALFVGGREVARQAGAMGTADIVRWVQQHAPR